MLDRLWGDRLITEPNYTEIQQLVSEHQVHAAARKRSNSRGGRGAAATMVSAIRRLYRRAELDRLIHPLENPAARVSKPRHVSSSRHALSLEQIHDLGRVASETGNDRPLDALILRFLIETACRRGGLVRLAIEDLNVAGCLVRLREKGGTVRWQPISPTLMQRVSSTSKPGADRKRPSKSFVTTTEGQWDGDAWTTCSGEPDTSSLGQPHSGSAPIGYGTRR
ncbi:hypothetical protein [Nocardia sp. NPDC005745]|uniref:tyrosine-type recombinase/integrase n=1 Tax=Nocardia sp. NPDC005745 TaxID=3157061 RepID=UPI0034003B69